jgi:hypothetical protein
MNNKENPLTISEFLHLTKLCPADLAQMLENGEMVFVKGKCGELLIDITNISAEDLARRFLGKQALLNEDEQVLLQEALAAELVSVLDPLIDEAIALALKWQQEEETTEEQ